MAKQRAEQGNKGPGKGAGAHLRAFVHVQRGTDTNVRKKRWERGPARTCGPSCTFSAAPAPWPVPWRQSRPGKRAGAHLRPFVHVERGADAVAGTVAVVQAGKEGWRAPAGLRAR